MVNVEHGRAAKDAEVREQPAGRFCPEIGGIFMKKAIVTLGLVAALCALGCAASAETAETAAASAETVAADTAVPAETDAETADTTASDSEGADTAETSPATGVEGIAVVAAAAIAAGGVMLIASKER